MDELGRFVSSMTGRGDLGRFESAAGELGSIMFSARFFKAQIDTFTAIPKYMMQPSNPVRQQAALATTRVLAMWAGILGFAHYLGLADLDPRSDKFGTIRMGNSTFDVTGGHASMMKLVTRLVTGERYDPKSGTYKPVDSFGSSRDDLIWDFLTGKLAPAPAMMRDMLRGEHFGGKEVTSLSVVENLLLPITYTSGLEAFQTKDMSEATIILLAEALGFSTSDFKYNPIGSGWKELRNGDAKLYNQATGELWQAIYPEIVKARNSSAYQKLSKEEKTKFMQKLEKRTKDKIINQKKYQKIIEAQKLEKEKSE